MGIEVYGASPRPAGAGPGRCFPVFPKVDALWTSPLWGLRVLKFDGAIAPRVLRFDSGSAAEGCGGRLTFIEGASLYKTFTTALGALENRPASLRSRKCIPPLVAGASTFPPLRGGTTTRAYCRDAYEENVSRCFILSPGWGKVRRSRIRGSRVAANHQNAYHAIWH